MKCIQRLSSAALVSYLTFNSAAAMSAGIERISNQTSSAQTEPVIVAQIPLGIIRDVNSTIDKLNGIRSREERRQDALRKRREWQQQQEQRRAEMERRRREWEAARQAATEEQRLEVERRRQYFESLSPENRKAYLAEQEAKKAQADKTAALLLMMLFVGSTGSSNGVGSDEGTRGYECVVGYNSNGTTQFAHVQMTRERASSQSMCSPL